MICILKYLGSALMPAIYSEIIKNKVEGGISRWIDVIKQVQ